MMHQPTKAAEQAIDSMLEKVLRIRKEEFVEVDGKEWKEWFCIEDYTQDARDFVQKRFNNLLAAKKEKPDLKLRCMKVADQDKWILYRSDIEQLNLMDWRD
jgi:hypothetical protein